MHWNSFCCAQISNPGSVSQRIHVVQVLAQRGEFVVVGQTLGGEARGCTFENAAHLDAVPDIFEREFPDDESPGGMGVQ
jgi:hypothetical protein